MLVTSARSELGLLTEITSAHRLGKIDQQQAHSTSCGSGL